MAKILLVDDDEDVRYALGKYLHRAGHEVVEAADGAQAQALATREHVELVITDIIMPEADGLELIMHTAQNQPRLPLIAISGGGRLGRAEYLDMAKGLGARAVLTKPVDPDELLALIDQLLAA